jgi:hypothetical protein
VRLSKHMRVFVFGAGTPFSMVAKRFNGEQGVINWIDDESDNQWVEVKMDDGTYSVHAIQCVPVPAGVEKKKP